MRVFLMNSISIDNFFKKNIEAINANLSEKKTFAQNFSFF